VPTGIADAQAAVATYRGEVLLVNFWTSWCPPCIREMPALERLALAMTDKPFRILMINVAEPPGIARRFARLAGAGIVLLRDPDGRVAGDWGVASYPTTFLIGARGRVRERIVGAVDWDDAEWMARFEELLADAAPAKVGD
jgi:thiol-disulfide isomerase/thioredoxin